MVHAMVEVMMAMTFLQARDNHIHAMVVVPLNISGWMFCLLCNCLKVLGKCRSSDTAPLILARVTQDVAEVSMTLEAKYN